MAIDAGYTITPLSGSGIQIQYSADSSTWHATFTDGDVYMRQKVDGGDWTDPIKIVGEDGKNAITMTSATTPSGEYEGQIGVWQGQIYKWTSNAWVNQNANVPTDAVLHYSFDEVPDYPDGNAVYLKNKNFTSIGTWRALSNSELSIENNGLKIKSTSSSLNYIQAVNNSFTAENLSNKIIKIKYKANANPSFRLQDYGGNYTPHLFDSQSLGNGQYVVTAITGSYSYNQIFSFLFTSASIENYVVIDEIYIGDGSYSTPIIDNANGQNNAVNNGGIAVQGVSGKGAYFLNGKYADVGTDFNLNDNFTFSVWAKADNTTSSLIGNIFVKDSHFILRNGANFSNGDYFMLYLYDKNGTNLTQGQGNIGALLPNEWTHIVIVRENTTLKSYRNGVLNKTITLANSSINKNTNACSIGGSTNTRPQSIDDLLIFDRALSEKEVLALYQNKANTPKYYTLSDYNLDAIDDDKVIDHLTEKPQLLSRWLEIYNAKNVTSALPTSSITVTGEYKGLIDDASTVGVLSTTEVQAYITASNALRSAFWNTTNGYLRNMDVDSTVRTDINLDSLFATYRQTLQIARTQITQQQASIASALSVVNSNPFQLLPVNSQGVVITGGYDNTGTRLQVFNGTTVLTPKSESATLSNGEWNVTANGSGIVAGSQTVGTGDNKYIDFGNVSNLTAETAVITYTINVMLNNTQNTIYVVQKFGKSKEGADGRIYTLLPDYTAVKKSADGSVLTPSSVTVQAKSWTGSSIPEPYSQGDLVALENGQQIASESLEHSITFNPTGDYPVVVNLYRHGTNTLIDTVTIPILQEVKGDTGRGLQSETSYYKLSANLTETFDSTTISTWTDSADSTPTAQKPYLHHAVLSEYTEEPTNVYGDDVIIREYVTNGTNGTSTRYSSASTTSSTTTIALNTITGNTAVVGDVIIANSLLFVVTAVGSTNATVQYKQSIKGADNKSVTVLLSNQNPNVTSNSDGTSPVLTNTVTDIRVYENETELKYDASSTSNGYYKVTVTASGCTHSSITDKGDYAQVNAISAMSADNATRIFTISGKRSDGTTFSFSAVQTITKSKKGNKGDTGVGITAVTEYYLRNNSSTAPAFDESTLSNWSTTASNPISTAQYLWNAERITKSDGTTTTYEYMTPHLAMKYTANGKGIVSIKNYYLASSLDSGVTTETQGWTEAVQTVSSTNRYLWNYEEIIYTTGNPTKTSPAIIGTFGAVSQGNWTASHSYKVSDIVYYQGSSYICKTAHTSGNTFDSSKWNKLADKGADGQNAQFVEITAPDGLMFLNGLPDTLNLIAETTEITSPTYKWYKKNQNNISWNILPETSNTLSVSAVGVYKVVVNDSWTDFATVTAVSENYVSSLSNENFSVVTDPNLVVIDTVTRTIELKAFLGSNPLIPTTSGSGTPASGYFRYSVSGNNQKFTIATQNDEINRKGIISINPIANAVISSEIITVTIKYDSGLTETKTISISAAIKGGTGNTGVSMRHKGNWESGQSYVNNSNYIDVVYYTTNGCSYSCKQSHTASDSINPTNENYWNKIADKGDSSLSASLSTSQVVLDCLPNRKVQTSQTIRVPYSAVNGNARTACTVTKINDVSVSTGSSLNKDIDISGVKLTQNTVGTSSVDGSFTLSIEADATLGGVTSTYDKIIIPVVINVDNTPFTKNLVITKNVLTARFEVSQDSVYFTQRRNNLSNFEQYTISVAVKIGDVSRSISSISVTSLTGLTITSSTSNKTVTLKTSNGGTSPNGTITITVVSNEVTYTKTISIISKKSGKYLGKATNIGSSPYNQVTIEGRTDDDTANVGDFITWAGSDDVSKGGTTVRLALNYMYCKTGTSSFAWQNYEDDDDAMTSFSDVMSIIDSADSSISDNIKASVLCQRLVSANAFINKLFVRKIKLVTEGQSVGAIYGGKYNADGSIDTEATTDKGVYLDADGEFKASNGQFSGVVQDEKGFSYFNELLYEITVVNKTTQETSYYENLTYEQFLAYLNNSQYSTRQLGVKILNNGIEVFSLSQGQYIPQSYKIYSTNNILYVPTEDDYVGFSPADEFPSNNYIWIKYYQSNKLRSVEKLSRTRGYGYKLTSDGRAEFYDDVIIDGDLYLFGKEILKKARYDNDRHRYVNICSDDYDYNQGEGFNFGYDGSGNSYADIKNLDIRNINGWKKSNETYSKITFDANNFAFNGQRTYTNITANSYSPSSSSSQRSALFNKIASIYDKIGGGYTHLGFKFGYDQSGTQQVTFSGSIYRIEKASDTVYRVHIYDEFGQTQENYLAVTSSSCIIRTEASGSQVTSSVSTVKFVSIN